MFRGTKTFTCDNCGERFVAPDFEYCATIFSVPQKCPACGSLHTMPYTTCPLFPLKDTYIKIWQKMDQK